MAQQYPSNMNKNKAIILLIDVAVGIIAHGLVWGFVFFCFLFYFFFFFACVNQWECAFGGLAL